MRRLYLDLLARRAARGDWLLPLRAARSVAGVLFGEARPLLGTLITTYRCDLDCAMCDLPSLGDRKREWDAAGLCGILDGMAELGVLGVGVTGGEPLLRADLPQVLRHGTRRGLVMHLNTNGSLVTEEGAREFSSCGLASINVSLDGPDAATHDRLRARPGSFARVLRALARLVAVPRRSYRVALTCALGEGNAEGVEGLLSLARDVGVDRVGFLPVHDYGPTGARSSPAALAATRRLQELSRGDPLLDNSSDYLSLFPLAFAGARNPVPCSAARTSVVVDCYGEVFPCVPLNARRRGVGRGDVRRVWRSRAHRAARASLRSCRACFWNCHTEMNLALARLGGRA
ncbi:MAG: radical SAM protein [Planctomycetaceae bacterium]